MEDILVKRREIFFNNLVLLGFDKMLFEKKYGITFHKDMFVLPNKKGYEIVTYFLFSKLSSTTGKDYNIQWPLLCKEHDRVFQKTCYSHLMNFSKENCVRFPRFVQSLLSTFGGDRFYDVYLAFSTYVLYKTIQKNGNVRPLSLPSVSQESFKTSTEILQLSTSSNMKKFRDIEMISCSTHNVLMNFAKMLNASLAKLKDLLRAYDEMIKRKKTIILSLYPTVSDGNFDLSKIADKCLECLKPVLKQRKILDKFLSSEQEYWQYLCSEVGENAESLFLNGQDYKIQVTEYLPENYAKELKNVGCLSSHDNGKLSVERFIKIFMAYLAFAVESLKMANLNDLKGICSVEDVLCLENDLKNIKNLNKNLCDKVIPGIENNIEKYKIACDFHDIYEDLELSDGLFCPLPMPSFDVKAVQQRTSHFDSSLENMFLSAYEKPLHSKNDSENAIITENNPEEYSFTTLKDQNLTSSSFSLVVNPNKKEENHAVNKMAAVGSCTSLEVNKSFLDDLDISSTTHFKMRESWLEEELLNTMTLPDVSFDD